MQYIKQNTSGVIQVGPIVKSTDGYSPLTGIASGTATASILFVYGTSSTGDMTTSFTWDEIATVASGAMYTLGLASTPIGTIGHLRVYFNNASAIPTYEDVRIIAANPFDSLISTSDYLEIDMVQIGGTGITTQTAVNFSTWFDNAGVGVGKDIGDVSTVATANFNNMSTLSTANLDNFSTFGTANIVEANIVAMASQAITTDAADNWDNYFFNNDAVSTERISDTITATPSTVTPLNVGAISSIALTTQAGANWQLFFNAGAGVTTEVVSDLPTTADVLTTASNVNVGAIAGSTLAGATALQADVSNLSTFTTANQVDIGAILGTAITTQAAVNWSTFFDNAGVGVGKDIGDMSTIGTAGISTLSTADLNNMSTFGTANQVDLGAILGTAVTTQAAVNWSTFFDNAGVGVGKDIGDMSTIGTAGISTLSTADLNNMSTFGTGVVYDTLDHGQLMQYVQGYITGDFKVTGAASNQIVYDDYAGGTFFSHTITSALRTFTSN